MRILFVSHYFPPEVNAPANRTHEHARQWVRDGHEVTVITGVPNHPRGEIFPGYRNRLLQEERIDGIRVLRTWTYVTPNEGFVRRTLNYLLFAAASVLASLRAPRPDVVVATSPQFFVGLAGAVISRLRRRPFVLEVRDLWPDSIVQLGQLRSARAIRFLEWVETRLYRSAAGIVVNTRAFIDHISSRGVPRDRIELVYNGIDAKLFAPRPPDPELLRRHGLEGRWLAAYIGTLGLAHALGTILDTAEGMRDREDVAFLLIGDGADRARLEAEAARRGLTNVRFLGLRPRAEIPAWIASVDCLLVMLRDLPVFETVIPSKVFEFCAQQRPVVVAARGEIRRLVEEAKAGFLVDPEDAVQLADVLERIRTHPEEAALRARAGREWVDQGFQRDALASRMAEFLERITGSAP
ncbi:MAG: glycosyltransferase family 4 protein [Deltaproteobacteria bacterium]|nr:glycosyltransferase family 4 protein [Deltaproteobacteria bacterium]